ncbi:acetylcholinesterase-1 [Trichonephila clavipes]|nr:acetylcholinesterase-1 [Trichonephila clavipes]
MYGVPNSSKVNDVRFYLFSKTYQSKELDDNFEKKCRSFDSSSLPPCKAELYQHLLRVRYVTKFWRNAHLKNPSSLSPLTSGWIVNDDKYDLVWFAGKQFTSSAADIVIKRIWDILEALKWVRRNIGSFGGDPNQITLHGHSSGAFIVSMLCLSPLTKGLFSKAILQSSSVIFLQANPSDLNVQVSQRIAKTVGCATNERNIQSDTESVVSCLRNEPRSGIQSEVSEKVLRSMMRTNPTLTSTEVGLELGIHHTTALNYVKVLDFMPKTSDWVPLELSEKKLKDRISISYSNLACHKREPCLDHLVTGDEKWIEYKYVVKRTYMFTKRSHHHSHPKLVDIRRW